MKRIDWIKKWGGKRIATVGFWVRFPREMFYGLQARGWASKTKSVLRNITWY